MTLRRPHWLVLAVLAVALCSPVSTASAAKAGELDPTFGESPTGSGLTASFFPSGDLDGQDGVVTSGDRILMAGQHDEELVVGRYTTDGRRDPAFDHDGLAVIPKSTFTALGYDSVFQVAVGTASGGQPIVAATLRRAKANQSDPIDCDILVAQLKTDGDPMDGNPLDTDFHGIGFRIIDFAPQNTVTCDQVAGVGRQSTGDIVVGGASDTAEAGDTTDWVAARVNSDGTLDSGFEGGGKTSTTISQDFAFVYDLVVTRKGDAPGYDDEIYMAGAVANARHMAVMKLSKDGVPDNSFDQDGKVVTTFGNLGSSMHEVIVDSQERVYGAGDIGGSVGVVRYKDTGALDGDFDQDGAVSTSYTDLGATYAIGDGIALDSSGRVVVGGLMVEPRDNDPIGQRSAIVARYGSDGKLDNSFSGDGRNVTRLGQDTYGTAIGIQSSAQHARILVMGTLRSLDNKNGFFLGGYKPETDPPPVNVYDVEQPDEISPGVEATFRAFVENGGPQITWDFGDGTPTVTSTSGQSRKHTFANAGKYTVKVSASNSSGQTDTEQFQVIVDGASPQIHVATPRHAQHFGQGQRDGSTKANYFCTDDVEVARCVGSTANGDYLRTDTPGEHTFVITAVDAAGHTATANIAYFVDAATSAGSGKRSYSISTPDTITPQTPYIDEQGRLIECFPTKDGSCFLAPHSVCEEGNLASYDKAACDRRKADFLLKQNRGIVNWQAGTVAGLFDTARIPEPSRGVNIKLPEIRFAIYDSDGNVIASGGGNLIGQAGTNLIGQAGTNLIGQAGTNLTVGAGQIWVPRGHGVKVVKRNAGEVTDSKGNVIASGGGNFVPTSGGNVVFKEPGWQIIDRRGNVIASGGGNVIASGGGNVIASGGGNVIASGGGNLIGQAGTNLIGQAGTNIVSVGDKNALVMSSGRFGPIGRDALPQALLSFMELSFSSGRLSTDVLAGSRLGNAVSVSRSRKRRRRQTTVLAKSRVKVVRPGVYSVSLKLTPRGRRVLKALRRKRGRVRLTLRSTITAKGTKRVSAKRGVTVKPRGRKRRRR